MPLVWPVIAHHSIGMPLFRLLWDAAGLRNMPAYATVNSPCGAALDCSFNRPDGRWIVRAVWQTAGLGCPLTSTSVVSRLRQDKSPLLNCSSGNAPGASAHLLVYLSPVYREPVRLTEMPPKEPELTGRPQRTATQWGKVTLLLKLCGTLDVIYLQLLLIYTDSC